MTQKKLSYWGNYSLWKIRGRLKWPSWPLSAYSPGPQPRAPSRGTACWDHKISQPPFVQTGLKRNKSKKRLSSLQLKKSSTATILCHCLPDPFPNVSKPEKASKEVPNRLSRKSQNLFPHFNNPDRTRSWRLFLCTLSLTYIPPCPSVKKLNVSHLSSTLCLLPYKKPFFLILARFYSSFNNHLKPYWLPVNCLCPPTDLNYSTSRGSSCILINHIHVFLCH